MLWELKVDRCKGILCSSPTDFNSLSYSTLSNILENENWLTRGFWTVKCLKIAGCEELIYIYSR